MLEKCQICGEMSFLTVEHLPQKSLFPKEIRSQVQNFNTVQACHDCNNGSKVSDELAKVFIGMVGLPPWIEQLRKSVDSTLDKNARLNRLVAENTTETEVTFADGITRPTKIVTLKGEHSLELVRAVERMVKAFYFKQYEKVLVEHYEVSIFHFDSIHESLKKEILSQRELAETFWVNSKTVSYTFFNTQESDIVSVVNLFGNMEFYFVLKELGWREN